MSGGFERPVVPGWSPPPLTASAWLRLDLVAPVVDDLAPASVLEIGAGVGGFGARFAACVGRYVGVEPSDRSREVLARRVDAVPGARGSVVADLDDVDADLPFDVVAAFEVLEHIEDDAASLARWVTMLRPGGTLLLTVPAFTRRFGPADALVGHVRRYDPEDLRTVAAVGGLERIDVRVFGFPAGVALEAARNVMARRALARRDTESDRDARTASSGRWNQPDPRAGEWIRRVMLPARRVQRPFRTRGTGLVMTARRPLASGDS